MGGKKTDARDMQMDVARQQNQVMREMLDFSRQRTAQMDRLQAPTIDFYTALASGDKDKQNTALSPMLASASKSFDTARSNIFDSVAPGAAREFTLGQLERDKANTMAALPNNMYLQSLDMLAQLGGAQGNFGLQQLGAGMRAGEASANTAGMVQQADNQRKAAQMGLLGSIAGAGGYITGMKVGR